MGDFASHHIFGEIMLSASEVLAGGEPLSQICYNWGLQGPDILFAHRFFAGGSQLPAAGSRMHKEETAKLFEAMAEYVCRLSGREEQMARSYFYGFLCHYCLDAALHPYVYAIEERRCAADSTRTANVHHFMIETDIDIDLFAWYHGLPAAHFRPGKYYTATETEKRAIARLYVSVLRGVYGVDTATKDICDAIDAALRLHQLQYAPAKAAAPVAKLVDALTKRKSGTYSFLKDKQPAWDSLNLSHTPWKAPFMEEERRENVPEMIGRAKKQAVKLLGTYHEIFTSKENRPVEYRTDFSGKKI